MPKYTFTIILHNDDSVEIQADRANTNHGVLELTSRVDENPLDVWLLVAAFAPLNWKSIEWRE